MAKEKKNAENTKNTAVSADETTEKAVKNKKAFNKRKFKYGSIATAITVVVIAVVVLVNVVVNMASDKVNMSIDLTTNGNFEISQQTIDYLNTVTEPVSIVCMSDELTFQTSNYIYYKQAYEVLKKYSIYNDNITLKFVDMVKDPTYADRYKDKYKGEISAYSIVVESDKRIKVLTIQDLYNTETQFDYSSFTSYDVPVSSKAEQEITSAIMYVTDPDPMEAVLFKSETSGTSYDNINSLLAANGYEVTEIDPLVDTIPEDADIVVIDAPLNDYDTNVIDMLYDFLDNGGNLGKNLIYLADYTQKSTANIDVFLAEWGIKVEDGVVGDQDTNNLQGQSYYVVRNYITDNDYSGNVAQTALPVIDYQSRPITLLFDSKDTRSTVALLQTKSGCFIVGIKCTLMYLSPLLQTSVILTFFKCVFCTDLLWAESTFSTATTIWYSAMSLLSVLPRQWTRHSPPPLTITTAIISFPYSTPWQARTAVSPSLQRIFPQQHSISTRAQ